MLTTLMLLAGCTSHDPFTHGEVEALRLENATLAEACSRLSAASGIPVVAKGDAQKRITLELEEAGFWDAVLEVCDAGGVGFCSEVGEEVVLGTDWARCPAQADGPILITARGDGNQGEREGELRLTLIPAPGLNVVGYSEPVFSEGRDYEG